MNSRCRSVVWDHFQKKDNNSAKCNYCSHNIKYTGGSLGNLRRHLSTKHTLLNVDTQIQRGVPEPSDRNAALESVGDPLNEHKHPIMDDQPSTSKSQEIPVSQLEKGQLLPTQ
nr:unnamed protein product [Callosobruchus analis]